MSGRGRIMMQRLLEAVVAISLVLVFFVILIMVFNLVFPEGSGLQFIFEEQTNDRSPAERRESLLQVIQGEETGALGGDESWAATLIQTRNAVKSKKADDIAWNRARTGMRLQNLDAVQTLEDSSASIRFDDRNILDLGQNSLIVIRRMEKDLLFREKRSFMVVVDGELRGRIVGDDESDIYLEVETPNAVARIKTEPGDRDGVEFKIDVFKDESSAVTIYAGEGEVEALGETVILGTNQLTRIEAERAPTEPVTLPGQATPLEPVPGTVFSYRSLPPRVELEWQRQPGITRYHLLLAEDEQFTRVLVDRVLDTTGFRHGNLREGRYFWKVSAISPLGEGRFSPVRRFELQQDQEPPALEVRFPDEPATQAEVTIAGKTEPGARVFISGQAVDPEADGRFVHTLRLRQGINLVVVEAVDPAGNVSYRSRMINGRY